MSNSKLSRTTSCTSSSRYSQRNDINFATKSTETFVLASKSEWTGSATPKCCLINVLQIFSQLIAETLSPQNIFSFSAKSWFPSCVAGINLAQLCLFLVRNRTLACESWLRRRRPSCRSVCQVETRLSLGTARKNSQLFLFDNCIAHANSAYCSFLSRATVLLPAAARRQVAVEEKCPWN